MSSFGAFLLGRDGVPRPAHKQGGLFGDVFADHAAALRNARPEHGFIVWLEVAGECDIVAIERAFWVGLGVGLGNDAGCGGFSQAGRCLRRGFSSGTSAAAASTTVPGKDGYVAPRC